MQSYYSPLVIFDFCLNSSLSADSNNEIHGIHRVCDIRHGIVGNSSRS